MSRRDHARGRAGAEVTLVEYGDYECPHCRNAHAVVRQLQRYVGPEHLRHVFRHFPVTQIRPRAERAAQAAEAAAARGRFWEAHDLLFERRGTYEQVFRRHAAALGVDAGRLLREVATGAHLARVRADFMGGVKSGVRGTPAFFINGAPYEGGYDFDSLLSAVEAAGAADAPAARAGTPDEVAKAVLFLASDDGSYVNGVELFVDGGASQV